MVTFAVVFGAFPVEKTGAPILITKMGSELYVYP